MRKGAAGCDASRSSRAQYGVIAAAQLQCVGCESRRVLRRVEPARLHRLHQGVYAVGHPGVSREGRWLAAVLASGRGAVLSHGGAAVHWESAACRWRAGRRRPSPTQAGRRARTGIHLHRRAALGAGEVTRHRRSRSPLRRAPIADLSGQRFAPRLGKARAPAGGAARLAAGRPSIRTDRHAQRSSSATSSPSAAATALRDAGGRTSEIGGLDASTSLWRAERASSSKPTAIDYHRGSRSPSRTTTNATSPCVALGYAVQPPLRTPPPADRERTCAAPE